MPLFDSTLVGRVAEEETSTIIIFDVMNVVGLLLTSIALLPALLSSTVSRTSTWIALLVSSIFYSSSYLLLLPIGQRTVAQPAYGVCLYQASLIYSAPVFVSFAGLSYVLQIYFGVPGMVSRSPMSKLKINTMLLIAPVFLATFMFIVSLVVGVNYPDTVTIDSTRRYCHITERLPRVTAAILIGLGTSGMIAFEVLISVHISRNWIKLRTFAWYKFGRIVVFTIFPFGAFTLNIAGLFSSGTTNDKWNLLLPILPLGAAIIFGSRRDIVGAWKFWDSAHKREALGDIYEEAKPEYCLCPHCGKKADSSGTLMV